MKITQLIKQLNSVEVGEGNTNDVYVAVPAKVDLAKILPTDTALELTDITEGKIYTPKQHNIRLHETKQNGQYRIAGVGGFFRKYDTEPGDRFILEIHDNGEEQKLLMGLEHRPDVIVLKKLVNAKQRVDGMIILNEERFKERATGRVLKEKLYKDGQTRIIEVSHSTRKKKKQSSTEETDFYNLLQDDVSLLDQYKHDEYVEIDLRYMTFHSVIPWRLNTFNIE